MSTIPRTIRGGRAVPFPKAAGGAGNAVHEGWIYVACGIVDGHASGTVSWFDEFDPDTRTWRRLHDAPRPRDHFSAVVSEGRLHLVGAMNTSHHEPGYFGAVIPEVDVYDFGAGKWSTLPDRLGVPTVAGGLGAPDGSIYYFGGESAQKPVHFETHRLDIANGRVRLAAPLVQCLHGGGATVLDGRICFATGSGGRGGGPEFSSTEVYTPNRRGPQAALRPTARPPHSSVSAEPSPCRRTTTRFGSPPPKLSTLPPGQVTSMASTPALDPRPKCSLGSWAAW